MNTSCSTKFLKEEMGEDSAMRWILDWTDGVQFVRNLGIRCLSLGVYVCLALSGLLFLEWIHVMFLATMAKAVGIKPRERYKWEDLDDGDYGFPMVLVQIPIYNEIEAMVEKECARWAQEGVNIRYQIRETRAGYKAGALRQGLLHDYAKACEYVVIFDTDFQPDADFLKQSIPFLVHNPELGLVQARWRYVNADECFLTRMQEMSLDYHFVVEQEAGSSFHSFFSFNGSGGIWRIATINDAGGWNSRTTVEDMDLAVRAGLKGWKFLYLGELEVMSELPSTFKAYRYQQHRWSCGPANLFRKMVVEITKNKEVSLWTKVYMVYNFFFIRKIIGTMFTFLFYGVVLPCVCLLPEVDVPKWGAVAATFLIATVNALVSTPRSLHLAVPWILFENVMSFHRAKGLAIGLLEAKRANEWVVTEKRGDALKNQNDLESSLLKKPVRLDRFRDRILAQELGIAAFLFACGCYNVVYGDDKYYIYLFPQSIFFTVAGFSLFGTVVPSYQLY
ncbi:glucomannan 4-beta-mannosyltransferase 2-like isoform X2 [Andrographis paniculata]|uniref:glucomannan 4-beta-mannosyltransferase 2-like isoform X2 n=1 Tax=Andrographis paniculata TaxID=175694 RepID=UPI0021E91229|nr:glucomannan 4-beta-mannosyltransferase 2-like isoform X2 [Andrographis paniculata]